MYPNVPTTSPWVTDVEAVGAQIASPKSDNYNMQIDTNKT